MKSILIVGKGSAGKSTTIHEVCNRLNPTQIFRLYIKKNNLHNSRMVHDIINNIYNNTFIIEVSGKWVLIVAGAPTEQNLTITILLQICILLKIDISLLIVSKRSFERKFGFDTEYELKLNTEIVLKEDIKKINIEDFKNSSEWNNRINKIVETINSNII